MSTNRAIHPDFLFHLDFKDGNLIELYKDLRAYVLDFYPASNELLYHTHALTSVYTISEKLSTGFCMIPIYTKHLNLGFNKGTLLPDPNGLLEGTGKLIRHIPIKSKEDYRNEKVGALIQAAINYAIEDLDTPVKKTGMTISKIKR